MLTDVLENEALTGHNQPMAMSLTIGDTSIQEIDLEIDPCEEQDADDHIVFAGQLLSALATMASSSKRRQADLSAAMRRSGLEASGQCITAALHHLEQIGCIEDLVPLYDGGMLMAVTSRGIEHLNSSPRWTMLDSAGYRLG